MTKHWGQNWSSLDSVPAKDRLSSISIPTLIITGSEDAEDIKSIAKLYSQKIPNCKQVVVDGSAHLVSREDATTFDQYLLSFLYDD